MRSLLGRLRRSSSRSLIEQLATLTSVGDGSTLSLDFTTGVLDPRLTFTRASNATFINSSGLVQYADANLLIHSQGYTNVAWFKSGIDTSATGLNVANTTTAPDGSNTGLLIRANSASGSHRILQTNGTTGATYLNTAGGAITPVTLSAYFKANGSDYCALKVANAVESRGVTRTFNLTNGVVSGAEDVGWSCVSAAATPVGNGWYRCEITVSLTRVDANDDQMSIWLWVANGPNTADRSFTNSAASVWVWGAQVAIGANALEYRATTTASYQAPRFDYDPTSIGTPRGLLIEGQANQLLNYSEDYSQAVWTKATVDRTTGQGSPDGGTGATLISENATSYAKHNIERSQSITAGIHTFSIWVKEPSTNSRRYVCLQIADGQATAARYTIVADLQSGTITASGSTNGTAGAPTGTGHSITPYRDGWYRLTITMNHVASPCYPAVLLSDISSLFGGNNQPFYSATTPYKGLIVWGAQLETGSGASSYIPTGASQGTRNADDCSMTGTNFSSWFNATEGTILAHARRIRTSDTGRIVSANDNTANESFDVAADTTGKFIVTDGGSALATISPGTVTANTAFKIAAAFNLNDVQAALNGTLGTQDTSVTMPTVTQLMIGRQAGASPVYLNGAVSLVKFWPTRLPNATLQSLTT